MLAFKGDAKEEDDDEDDLEKNRIKDVEANHPVIMVATLRGLLSRPSSSSSSYSSSTSPLEISIVHSKELHSSRDYSKWNILFQLIASIYSIGSLSLKTAFSIKIYEETISLNYQCGTFQLLSRVSIDRFIRISLSSS